MRARTTAALALFAVLLLAACAGHTDPAAAPAKAGPPAVVAVQRAAAAPMSSVSTAADQIAAAMAISPTSVGAFDAADVRDAAKWLSYYLARAHADRSWMCSKSTNSPTKVFASQQMRDQLTTKNGKANLQYLEGRLSDDGPCTWLAPGVTIGQQTLHPVVNAKYPQALVVQYRGDFGYSLRPKGHDSLAIGEFRAEYWLKRKGSGWELWWYGDTYRQVASGWPADLALPADFESDSQATPVAGADAAAWTAVDDARKKTLAAPGATWTWDTAWTAKAGNGKAGSSQTSGPVGLKDGFAALDKVDELIFDGGRVDLRNRGKRTVVARVGESVPKHATWLADDPTALGAAGSSDTSPFVALALLEHTTSAAPATCNGAQSKTGSTRCFVARVSTANAAYSKGIASRLGWGHLCAGQSALDVRLGLDAQGRIASIGYDLDQPEKGKPADAVVTGSLTAYTAKAPSSPARPAADTIAKDGTYYAS